MGYWDSREAYFGCLGGSLEDVRDSLSTVLGMYFSKENDVDLGGEYYAGVTGELVEVTLLKNGADTGLEFPGYSDDLIIIQLDYDRGESDHVETLSRRLQAANMFPLWPPAS